MLIAVYVRKPTPMLVDGGLPAAAAQLSSKLYASYRVSIILHSQYIGKPIAFKYY